MPDLTGFATLQDFASRQGFDKKYQRIIELQTKTNKILKIMPFKMCNSKDYEEATLRYSLPEVAWRMINRGTKPSKSKTKQVSFTCGEMEALAEIDEKLARKNNMQASWMMSENAAFLEAMNQEMATTLFYGDEKINPAGFTGLGAYFYSKTNQDDIWADQIIDCGGTGDNLTSVWFVGFGEQQVYGLFPEGDTAGFTHEYLGKQKVTNDKGEVFFAHTNKYNWSMGLAVKDPRYVVRLANVDLKDPATTTIFDKLIEGYYQIENPDNVNLQIFCNKQFEAFMAKAARNDKNTMLSIDTVEGKPVVNFWGVPFQRCAAILNTESQLV